MVESVRRPAKFVQNRQMTVLGYIVAAGAAVVLFPLLPFLAVLWVVSKLQSDPADA